MSVLITRTRGERIAYLEGAISAYGYIAARDETPAALRVQVRALLELTEKSKNEPDDSAALPPSRIDPTAYAALQRSMFKLVDKVLAINARLLMPEVVDPHVAAVVFTVLGKLYMEDMAHVVDHPEAQRWIADLYAESRKQLRAISSKADH